MGRKGAGPLRKVAHRCTHQAPGVLRRPRPRPRTRNLRAIRRPCALRIRHRHEPEQRPGPGPPQHRHETHRVQWTAGGQTIGFARQDAVQGRNLPGIPAPGIPPGRMRNTVLKLTLAQINPTIGDIDGNVALMRDTARDAYRQGARLVIFPELSLTAYYPADLLDDPQFMRRVADGLLALLEVTREFPGLHWVVGAPTPNHGVGKHFHNSLLVLREGEMLLTYHKQLLPTYNVFDERRHFEPGPDVARVLEIEGVRCGFMICEDGWNDEGRDYAVNPFVRLEDASPDLVVSINASPSNVGKRAARHEIFGKASARHRFPIVYVNQVGGHDQLVYDGASFIVD